MGYNPCYCWSLRDGCITIGIWSLVYSLMQIGLFVWQSYVLQGCRQLLMVEHLLNNCQDWCPCSKNPSIEDTHTLVAGIFIIQIVNLIVAFFLLFASGALIYGIYTNSKHLVWPWFPCIVISIICSAIYCILWWAGNVESYWLVLTIVEFASVLVNIYCLLCITVQYNRILKGYVVQDDDEYKPKIVHEYVHKGSLRNMPEHLVPMEEKKQKNLIDYDDEYPYKKPHYPYPGAYSTKHNQQEHELLPAQQQSYSVKQLAAKKSPQDVGKGRGHPMGSPEFKTRFTEEWIKGVNGKVEPRQKVPAGKCKSDVDQLQDTDKECQDERARYGHKAKSLETLQQQERSMRSSKSKDSITSRSHHHHCHHHRHKRRCRHRRDLDEATPSSSDDEGGVDSSNNEGVCKKHARSCSSRRSTRSNPSKYADYASDTGYSATGTSAAGSESEPAAQTAIDDDADDNDRNKKRRRHNRRCCRHGHDHHHHQSVDQRQTSSRQQQRRRPRDVKRADDDRQRRLAEQPQSSQPSAINDLASSDSVPESIDIYSNMNRAARNLSTRPPRPPPIGAVPVFPPSYTAAIAGPGLAAHHLPPGTISIPQNIVIPGAVAQSAPGATSNSQPQKYQINSEITIRYDDSNNVAYKKSTTASPNDSAEISSAPGQRSTSTTAASVFQTAKDINGSAESRRYVSTAV